MSHSEPQWYSVINKRGSVCGKLKTANPADNYATRTGMKLVPIADLVPLNPRATDERTIAERKWAAPIRASKPQQPCDHGIFGDEKDQLELCEMFQDPTND